MNQPNRWISDRLFAVTAILAFLPAMASFAITGPDWSWVEYPGILFHLAVFALVWRLPSPDWGRAAGSIWIGLDVLTGVLAIQGVDPGLGMAVRLGGHVFAGLWFIAASLASGSRALAVIGTIGGVWLGGYTLVSALLPTRFMGPASLLILVWLVVVAWRNRNASATLEA